MCETHDIHASWCLGPPSAPGPQPECSLASPRDAGPSMLACRGPGPMSEYRGALIAACRCSGQP